MEWCYVHCTEMPSAHSNIHTQHGLTGGSPAALFMWHFWSLCYFPPCPSYPATFCCPSLLPHPPTLPSYFTLLPRPFLLSRRLAEDDKEGMMANKVLDMLWTLAKRDDCPPDTLDHALNAHLKILDFSCAQVQCRV